MSPPRVLFVGRHDWANVSHRVARSMNIAAGHQVARVLVMEAHPFGYDEDMVLGQPSADGWRQWGRQADWLISTGDGEYPAFMAITKSLDGPGLRHNARRATAHVGSAYRTAPAEFDRADGLIGWALRFFGGDLYRFALSDGRARPYFAPPDHLVDVPMPLGTRVRIAHSPSNRAKKGTATILPVLEHIRREFPHADVDLIEGLPYQAAAARRGRAHIFVDQLAPEIGGFGASSVEALAAGCCVLADIRNVHPAVDQFYPRPPILDVRDPLELRTVLAALVADRAFLEQQRSHSFEWARRVASPEAVGRYWLEQLERAPPPPT